MKKLLIWLVSAFLTGTSFIDVEKEPSIPPGESPFDNLHTPWVDSVFNSLTPDRRIGQLFFAAAYSNLGQKHTDAVTGHIDKYGIGGLIFFQGGPKRQVLLTNRYQALSKTPLLVGMDAEWGLGMRLDSCVSFPRQMALGAIEDVDLIYRLGHETGRQCRRMGVHLNFAPVADVNSNPLNPVIGTRSFGENPREVSRRAVAYMTGMQRQHILTAAKHFPGHGNTSVDSHYSLPVVAGSYASSDSSEWLPYREMIRRNLTGVLAAHVHVPSLDSTRNLAASLSHRVLTDILRDSLGFRGLIYTDALNMKGVTRYFKAGELEVKALEAGADVLLMPADIPEAFAAVKAAVADGRLDSKRIEMSCRRVLAAKEWAGLNTYSPTDTAGLLPCLAGPETDLLNRKLTEASLTVVQNRDGILPLKRLNEGKTAILITGTSMPGNFLRTLGLYRENDYFFLDGNSAIIEDNALLRKLCRYSTVIAGVCNTGSAPGKGYGIPPNTVSVIDRLADSTDVVLCLFAPPYALSAFGNKEKMAAIVVSYQDNPLSRDYTAQLLYGAVAGTGKLPVSVDSVYRYNKGERTAGGLRLKYSVPEEAGIDSRRLSAIDTMVQNAVARHAMPGCQILAARNGVVFFKKEYGSSRYDERGDPVDPRHIYDLASLTKVAATLPSVMLLYDRKQIKMRDKLGDYLPYLDGSDKERITMIDVLTHQARLQPFIGFWLSTVEPQNGAEHLLSRSPDASHTVRLGRNVYLNNRTRFKDGYFAASEDSLHRLQAADRMFVVNSFADTILNGIRDSKLLAEKQYRYSDPGFIMLAKVVERVGGQPLDEFAARNFYDRLGASTLGYLPLKRFPQRRIIPTSNDTVFRKQWLQGYVHDENAALAGGVAGHAGLFGNADDLAKLMQMYLNKGTYGGERYMEGKTVEDFTAAPFRNRGNRRGIGFDKPDLTPNDDNPMSKIASPESFGHTGFTGTMVWADPATGLLFVFLSNRVCPDATNDKLSVMGLRAKIYDIFARAIDAETPQPSLLYPHNGLRQ